MKKILSAFTLILFALNQACHSSLPDGLHLEVKSSIPSNKNLLVISPKQCFTCKLRNIQLIEQAKDDNSANYVILLPGNFSKNNPLYEGFVVIYYDLIKSSFDFEDSFITSQYILKDNRIVIPDPSNLSSNQYSIDKTDTY
ncbi:hypothetical protein JCM31826_17940 [Thermaurantimonas aggregans]|uniref:Lipoprotein n=1 Tax=Thermaurantimonas aggregans TaxID=2173829 RepID=A0A401XMT8_9FLAO|nr:hypothetical protein [Thermaurantimonas aggregans]MCX8149393.1 hypothetical protein [Thermaurantimonas aggregans]GCD78312.1 hypothetical protein JCM31826_17940 [Thermaurantimonas aggregans]